MKLPSRIFKIKDFKGKDADIAGEPIFLHLNGKLTETPLKDVVSEMEIDGGEFYGNSLLSFYSIAQDGSLEVEGSKIALINTRTNEPVLIKQIQKPWIKNDGDISFENIQKFSDFFGIAKPEEVFTALSQKEKDIFISERASKEEAKSNAAKEADAAKKATEEAAALAKANEEKATADQAAAAAKVEAEKVERELRASIDPKYVQDAKEYKATQAFYATLDDFKEYSNGPCHLFYGNDKEQEICILMQRGATWMEEIRQENLEILEENDKVVKIEFLDGDTLKHLILNLEAGQIEIIDAKAKE